MADRDELVRVAGDAGLDAAGARALLDSEDGACEVRAELDEAFRREITAVPTFVFEGRWSVPGAQEPDTLLLVLRRVRDRL